MKKNILVYSGSRSEYGILKHLIFELKKNKKINTKVVLSGTHFSKKYGETFKEVERDKIKFDKIKCNFKSDKFFDINKSLSTLQVNFSKYIEKKKFDFIVILGDRLDLIPIAYSSMLKGIKICHLHGGEKTKYLIDEYIRHSVTKMSDFHFVSHLKYKKRLIQMGENPKNIFNVGSLSIDGIKKMKFLKKNKLEKILNINLKKKFYLITYQPLTLNNDLSKIEFQKLIYYLQKIKNSKLIFTFPNLDKGSEYIIDRLNKIKKINRDIHIFKSLGQLNYISLSKYASAVIGNSSSGIIEIPFIGTPVINFGERQSGREKSQYVIDCDHKSHKNFIKKIKYIEKNKQNIFRFTKGNKIFGKGNTAKKIANILANQIKIDKIPKQFVDIKI